MPAGEVLFLRLTFAIPNSKIMNAIVEILGQQFKVEKGAEIMTHRMEGNAGDKVEFTSILLADKGGKISVGTPHLNGKITATILNHKQGDKVIVFKKKRRKGYKVKNGHRQEYTTIKIDNITL